MILIAPVREVGERGGHLKPPALRDGLPHLHQSAGLLERKRAEQQRIDHAEDGAVGADAERERDDGDQREAGILQQRAQAVAQVLPECVHRFTSEEGDE